MIRTVRLSVRLGGSAGRGGAVAPVLEAPPTALIGAHKLTILIHGFNNDEQAAQISYGQFIDQTSMLRRAYPDLGTVCEFFWPGDIDAPRWIAAAFYAESVTRAPHAARVLADFLHELSATGPLEVNLICHSLGNRVALELARTLVDRQSSVRVKHLCLLAAAVPSMMVYDGGTLREAIDSISRTLVLHSEFDEALGVVFRGGQWLANEDASHAIGKYGAPLYRWSMSSDMKPYGHSDYWPGASSARHVREFLGLSATRSLPFRQISEREVARLERPHPVGTTPVI